MRCPRRADPAGTTSLVTGTANPVSMRSGLWPRTPAVSVHKVPILKSVIQSMGLSVTTWAKAVCCSGPCPRYRRLAAASHNGGPAGFCWRPLVPADEADGVAHGLRQVRGRPSTDFPGKSCPRCTDPAGTTLLTPGTAEPSIHAGLRALSPCPRCPRAQMAASEIGDAMFVRTAGQRDCRARAAGFGAWPACAGARPTGTRP